MFKVVINVYHGGFGLSVAAAEWMADRGSEEAKEALDYWHTLAADDEEFHFGALGTCRHDPLLVAVVEELGEAAEGHSANLIVVEVNDECYIIKEYDGYEAVQTPGDINWIYPEINK